jgi:hypothetical protein
MARSYTVSFDAVQGFVASFSGGIAKRFPAPRIRRFSGVGAAHGRDVARMARSCTVSVEVVQGLVASS